MVNKRVLLLSSQLCNVKSEFAINVPRPRDKKNPEVAGINRQLPKELEEEIQLARKESAIREAAK